MSLDNQAFNWVGDKGFLHRISEFGRQLYHANFANISLSAKQDVVAADISHVIARVT